MTSGHLGTPRVITDSSGAVKARHDYLPFGEEIGLVGGRSEAQKYVMDSVRQKFTSYERDSETGLDYAQARYYASAQGRFTSVDPILITKDRLLDPQTINLFVYARNNPLVYVDPSGEDITCTGGTQAQQEAVKKSIERLRQQSAEANKAFSRYDPQADGRGPNLNITIMADKDFDNLRGVDGTPTILGIASPSGGDAIDTTVPVGADVIIRSSAVNVVNENNDRQAGNETLTEGVLSHEVGGHAKDIYDDPNGYETRNKEDVNIPYRERRNEVSADRATKVIGLQRFSKGHVNLSGLKTEVRFRGKLLPGS